MLPARCTSRRFTSPTASGLGRASACTRTGRTCGCAAALERIADPALPLTELALDLGFASHSHFTDTFRRTFGRPPSAVRAAVRAHGSAEARRILEAAPALRS